MTNTIIDLYVGQLEAGLADVKVNIERANDKQLPPYDRVLAAEFASRQLRAMVEVAMHLDMAVRYPHRMSDKPFNYS